MTSCGNIGNVSVFTLFHQVTLYSITGRPFGPRLSANLVADIFRQRFLLDEKIQVSASESETGKGYAM